MFISICQLQVGDDLFRDKAQLPLNNRQTKKICLSYQFCFMLVSVNYLTMLFKTSFNLHCSQFELLDKCSLYCVKVYCGSKLFTNLVRNFICFIEVWFESVVFFVFFRRKCLWNNLVTIYTEKILEISWSFPIIQVISALISNSVNTHHIATVTVTILTGGKVCSGTDRALQL